jgi:hypothetical protein
MAWKPVFSPDSSRAAAKMEKNRRYAIVLDGQPLKEDFEMVWDPVFSPDGKKILVRGIKGGKYSRQVLTLT